MPTTENAIWRLINFLGNLGKFNFKKICKNKKGD